MSRKIARGKVRELLLAIGDVQDLIGRAIGLHADDKDRDGFEKGQNALISAFDICVKAADEYYPVNRKSSTAEPKKGKQ